MKESITQLHVAMPDFAQALPCSYSTEHANLMAYMSCKECSPFEIMDLYISNESPSDTGKDTCDYDTMTTHTFKQAEPVECDCDATNHNDNPQNYDPMYMKMNRRT